MLYLVGGLICIFWLIVTPTGLLGKADAIGYAVCHRIDSRSFHLEVRQFPLCVRCTGQYLGALIGLVFMTFYGRKRTGMHPKRVWVGVILIFIFYVIDGLNSYFYLPPFISLFPGMPHLYEPSSVLRLISGTGMGLVIAMVFYPVFMGTILADPDPLPAIRGMKSFFIVLGVGILADLIILKSPKFVLLPLALLSTAGVLILLSMVYDILWIRIARKENQFTQVSQAKGFLIAGFLTAIIQIALFDLIRFSITGSWNGIFFNT